MIVRNAVNNATNNQNKNSSSAANAGILTPGEGGQGNSWWNNRGFGNNNWNNERERSPIDGQDDNRWNFNNRGNAPGNANYNNMRLPVPNYAKDVYGRSSDQNDCEIIVVSKDLTEYAENIESRLKRVGLSVDLLFPNDDVPMGKVLANISSRGTLYAILVTHQNQELRSITVNVLHGIPAEHRNMPVDDAIAFIGTNFQENRQKVNLPKSVPIIQPQGNAPPLNERHPEAVQALLNLLAENRPLTVLQYERIIKYLQERKVLQIKAELGDAATDIHLPTPEELADAAKAEAKIAAEKELQDKIMHILNKPSIIPPIVPEEEPIRPVQVATSSTTNSNLLHDPKVQKALDSLLGGFQF